MIGHAWALVGFACLCAMCQYASGALPSGGALEAGSWGGPCADGYVEIEPLAVSGAGKLVRFCADAENLWYYADIEGDLMAEATPLSSYLANLWYYAGVEGDGERGTLQVTIPRHPADFRQYDYSACFWIPTLYGTDPDLREIEFANAWQVSVTQDARTLEFAWSGSESRRGYFGFYGQVDGSTYSEPGTCVAKVGAREHPAQMPYLDRLRTDLVQYVLQDGADPSRPSFDVVPSHNEPVPSGYRDLAPSRDSCFREVELDYALSDGRITKICRQWYPYDLHFYFSGVNSDAVLVVDVPYDYAPPLYPQDTYFLVLGRDTNAEHFLWPAYVTSTTNSYQTMAFNIPRGIESLHMSYQWQWPGSNERLRALVPLPGEQLAAGVPPGEVRCIDGHALMLGPDGDAACVDERSVEILQRRGFEVP